MPPMLRLESLTVWPIRLPFQRRFAHAAGEREETLSVLVSARSADGLVGWGETLPRSYVTGETQESVLEVLQGFWPGTLQGWTANSLEQALPQIEALPYRDDAGRGIHAARAAVELALLDLVTRHFSASWKEVGKLLTPISSREGLGVGNHTIQSGISDPLPTLSLRGRGVIRMSGVLGGGEPTKILREMFLLWLWGLRDFKLKVGLPEDEAVLQAIARRWGRAIQKGSITLRADANGAWELPEAMEHCRRLAKMGFIGIEEPLRPRSDSRDRIGPPEASSRSDSRWVELTALHLLDVMADESMVGREDAEQLLAAGAVDALNIRLSKNGGLLPALRLAQLAAAHGKWVQLGCMVGETSILTAAGRVFLALVPNVRFAEGSYGPWLLERDIARPPLKMGWGGRWKSVPGPGWGVAVRTDRVRAMQSGEPLLLKLT